MPRHIKSRFCQIKLYGSMLHSLGNYYEQRISSMIQHPTNHVCSDKDLPPESIETCSITARFMQKSFKTIEVCMSIKKAVILLFLPISIAFGQNLTQREIDDLVQKAEQGDIKAQRSIGFIHYEGNGLPKDAEKSIYWTKKSARSRLWASTDQPRILLFHWVRHTQRY